MNFDWRIVLGVFVSALLLVPMWMLLAEWNHIRKTPGGLKAWVADLPSVNYRTEWSNILIVITVVAFSSVLLAHSIFVTDTGTPAVGELQVEAVYAVFIFLGALQGINVAAYAAKRATASPEMVAATAAAKEPGVLPAVDTTKTSDAKLETKSESTTVVPVATPTQPEVVAPPPPPPQKKHAPRDD